MGPAKAITAETLVTAMPAPTTPRPTVDIDPVKAKVPDRLVLLVGTPVGEVARPGTASTTAAPIQVQASVETGPTAKVVVPPPRPRGLATRRLGHSALSPYGPDKRH